MRKRDRGEKEIEDEVANRLHVTRFIMLAPIACNTLRSFHGVIHRGVITNAYCGSAETRARASEPAARKFRGTRAISFCGISLPLSLFLSLSLSLCLVSISILSQSLLVAPTNNYNRRSVCIVAETLMRSFHRTLVKVGISADKNDTSTRNK